MHSLKNTAIAVILLGISFGLYQISLTPKTETDPSLIPSLDISDGLSSLSNQALSGMNSLKNQAVEGVQAKINSSPIGDAINQGLPELKNGFNQATSSLSDLKNGLPNLKHEATNLKNDLVSKANNQLQTVSSAASKSVNDLPLPNMPTLPSTTPKTAGEVKKLDTLSLTPPANNRQPISAIDNNGVQSLQYPGISNDFSNNDSNVKQGTQIAQREPVGPNRDLGLIAALKNQPEATPAISTKTPTVPSANSFQPAKTLAASTSAATASPIGTAKPEFDPLATELASTTSPVKTSAAPKTNSGFDLAANSFAPTATPTASSPKPSAATPAKTSNTIANAALTDANSDANFDQLNFKTVWPKVDELVAKGDHKTALQLLSRFYRDENLSGPQRQRLIGWLDALAGKVVFSEEPHLTGAPYVAAANESLTDIASQWKVPAQLIYNVNQSALPNPVSVSAGTKLKQINGPFNAEIKLDANVLTLFLGDMYAGRFPIVVGISGQPKPGDYNVVMKSESGFTWRDANGKDYPPGTAENGYGPHWIGLSGSLCMHAVAPTAAAGHHGCFGLSETDAKDVFAILSEGSKIKIVQ